MAKNGILIVESANHLRDRGLVVREAIEQASITACAVDEDDDLTILAACRGCWLAARVPRRASRSAGSSSRAGPPRLDAVPDPVAYLLLAVFVTEDA